MSSGVIGLVSDALLPTTTVIDQTDDFQDGQVALFSGDSQIILSGGISEALKADVPIVAVARFEEFPLDIGNHLDRRIVFPDRLTDGQLGRVATLVCGLVPGEIVDTVGLGAQIEILDVVKGIRRGYSASHVVDRLRGVVKWRADAEAKAVADAAKAFAPDPAKALETPTPKPSVRLRDLSGYGPAKDWGLQLAEDIQAFKRSEISWDDVDKGILLSGPPGCGKTTDLAFATKLATSIVGKFGLGDRLVVLDDSRVALDGSVIDEVDGILGLCKAKAGDILDRMKAEFLRLVDALLSRRYLDVDEVRAVIDAEIAPEAACENRQ